MKTGLGIALIVGLGCAPAVGADMPVKAPPPAAEEAASFPSWEGFYFGGDIGYGIGITKIDVPQDFQSDFFGSHGFTGGLLAGYNHMLAPRWVLGIEGDASWSDIDHADVFSSGFDIANMKLAEKQAYSVRARFGYLLAPNTLLYATGGWSWAEFVYSLTSNVGLAETATLRLDGPEIGFGVETQLAAGWSARLEYLEVFYNNGGFNSSVFGTTINVKPAVGTGRFALIYRFGPGDAASRSSPSLNPSWSGPTIAATVSAVTGTAKIDSSLAPGNSIDGFGASAILPTGLIGYNWRIAPRWVFGIDGGAAPGISTTEIHVSWTEAAHARLGYLLTPATMLYASTGWFGTGFDTTQLIADKVFVPQQRTNALEIGAGVETALDEHWAARFEYQYGFMETIHDVMVNITGTIVPPSVQLPVSVHPQVQSAQVGLVYRFYN